MFIKRSMIFAISVFIFAISFPPIAASAHLASAERVEERREKKLNVIITSLSARGWCVHQRNGKTCIIRATAAAVRHRHRSNCSQQLTPASLKLNFTPSTIDKQQKKMAKTHKIHAMKLGRNVCANDRRERQRQLGGSQQWKLRLNLVAGHSNLIQLSISFLFFFRWLPILSFLHHAARRVRLFFLLFCLYLPYSAAVALSRTELEMGKFLMLTCENNNFNQSSKKSERVWVEDMRVL